MTSKQIPQIKTLLAKEKIKRRQVDLLTRVMHDIRVLVAAIISSDKKDAGTRGPAFVFGHTTKFQGHDGSVISLGTRQYDEGNPAYVQVSRYSGMSSNITVCLTFPNKVLTSEHSWLGNLPAKDRQFTVKYGDFNEPLHWVDYLILRPSRFNDVYASLFQLYGALLVLAGGQRTRNHF